VKYHDLYLGKPPFFKVYC